MKKLIIYMRFLLFCIPQLSFAQDNVMVAVDANFIEPFKEIAELFETNTDIKVTPTFSSTGTLYTQITQGVPYDVFLSTDEKWPDDLYQKGFSEEPFVYAQGEVVLWSSRIDLCNAVFNAT